MQLFEALEYASMGWPVIPLHTISNQSCSCKKPNCKSPGKHPLTRHGLKNASDEKTQIQQWFDRWPDANVGVITGAQSGFIAVDIDPAHGGEDTFQSLLVNAGGKLPRTVEQETGSGGRHILFKHPGYEIRNSVGKLGPGIDIRGDNGYVVVPPSIHVLGEYRWIHSPSDTKLALAPDWLLDMLVNNTQKPSETLTGHIIKVGKRNTYLTSTAGRLRRQGKGKKDIETALLAENERVCQPPLSHAEISQIAASVSRYAMAPLHIWRDLVRSEHGPESPIVRHILMNLSLYMDAYGQNAAPSMETQAKETGLSKRSVIRAIASAVEDQWIYVEQVRYQGRAWKHNTYIPRIPDAVSECHRLPSLTW